MATLLEQLQALSTKRVFFGHQSVGNNLCYGNAGAVDYASVGRKGFDQVFTDNPTGGVTLALSGPAEAPLSDATIQGWDLGEWCEVEIGTNGTTYPTQGAASKAAAFRTLMGRFAALDRLPDYAGIKLCFADFGESFDEQQWTAFQTDMDYLEATYPGRIIFWTGALTGHPDANEGAADAVRHEFNERIRTRWGSTGRVFDFALREQTDSLGRLMNVGNIPGMAWEWSATWNPAWDNVNPVYPGGGLDAHPNNNFVNRSTLAYIEFLYNLAEPASTTTTTTAGPTTTTTAAPTTTTTTAAPGAMTTAHRTTGVAPLAVFFQAVTTVNGGPTSGELYDFDSGVTQPADLEGSMWEWDFGDPDSGVWSVTGLSKNTATGYTAAHVYETAGTYTVTLTVTQPDGSTQTYQQSVTVSAFSGTTHYASSTGVGNGLSEATPSSLADGMTWVNGGTNRQLLLNRGDTFNVGDVMWLLTAPGPNIVGAYGTGEKPKIVTTGIGHDSTGAVADPFNNVFTVASVGGRPNGCDWRFLDLEFIGPNNQNGETCSIGLRTAGNSLVDDLLLLRIKVSQFCSNLFWQIGTLADYQRPPQGLFIVDTESGPQTTVHTSPGVSNYMHGRWLAILGCNFHNNKPTNGSHILRIYLAHGAIISNTRLAEPGNLRSCLKLHGPCRFTLDTNDTNGQYAPDTRYVSITDCIMKHQTVNTTNPDQANGWAVNFAPQDNYNLEWISHIIYERNRHIGPSLRLDSWIHTAAPHLVIRNNTFDLTKLENLNGGTHAMIFQAATYQLTPENIRVYNNTIYFGSSFSEPSVFNVFPNALDAVDIRNNLAVYPYPGGFWGFKNYDGGVVPPAGQIGNNILVGNVPAADYWSNAPSDFALAPGSPAIDAGAPLGEVREDFVRGLRTGAMDVGAYDDGTEGETTTTGAPTTTTTTTTGPPGVTTTTIAPSGPGALIFDAILRSAVSASGPFRVAPGIGAELVEVDGTTVIRIMTTAGKKGILP